MALRRNGLHSNGNRAVNVASLALFEDSGWFQPDAPKRVGASVNPKVTDASLQTDVLLPVTGGGLRMNFNPHR